MRGIVTHGSRTCTCHVGKVRDIVGESSPKYYLVDPPLVCEHFDPDYHKIGTFKKAYIKILPDFEPEVDVTEKEKEHCE